MTPSGSIRCWPPALLVMAALLAGCPGRGGSAPASPADEAAASAATQPATQPATAPATAPASTAPAATAPATAPAAEPPTVVRQTLNRLGVTVATLSNGLTIIVQENHTVPVVTVRSAVRAGGMLEGPWLGSGISHLLEHLVAKGATRGSGHVEGPQESRDRLDEIGAQSNAYTSMDETTYFIDAAASRTDEAIEILADWMARPEISQADFQREHGVVQRELEMGRDNAPRQFHYAHMANFYGAHPAGVPVIGYLGALRSLTYADVLEYHRRTYVPQNMVFVVVGDVDSPAVMARIRAAFAGFEAARQPPAVLPEVPYLAGVRRAVQAHPMATDVAQEIAFRSVPLIHEDLYALDVLSYVLANGESSRLARLLKRERQLATSVDSSSWTPSWGAGQFTVAFRAEPEKADEAEGALLAELGRVVELGVADSELAKAKRQKVADLVYQRQSVQSQAGMLANDWFSTGDVDFSQQYVDRIQAVTAAQVQQAARRYLTPEAMVITRQVPAGSDLAAAGPQGQARTSQVQRFKLANGLTVVLSATDSVDLVSMNLSALGGVLAEAPPTNGLGTLMTQLSLKGAGGRSAEEIAEFFDRAGGAIAAQCGNNAFMWEATVLKAEAPEALAILADVVARPTFAQEELAKLRPTVLAGIAHIDEEWASQMQRHFRRSFFGDSPLALMPIGSAAVVKAADRDAVAAHHRQHVKAGSAVLSVFGNFNVQEMRRAVEEHLAELPAGKAELPIPPARAVAGPGERHVLATGNQQAAIMIGWPGMRATEAADVDAITVLDTIISGYQLPRGWLHDQLRGAQLVYVVHAYNWAGWAPGAFVVYAATQPDKARQVIATIRRLVERAVKKSFDAAQINLAVNMILTAELLENQTMRALAQQSSLDELYGFGYDYHRTLEPRLRAITPADLRRVAEKYLAGPAVETITTPRPEVVDPDGTQTEELTAEKL